MREPGISTVADKVSQDVIDYVELKTAAAKLAAVEALSTLTGNAIRIFILSMFCFLGLIAFLVAAMFGLAELIGSVVWAAMIIGGVCLIAGFALYASRKIFINPMVRTFSHLMFSPSDNRHDGQDEED